MYSRAWHLGKGCMRAGWLLLLALSACTLLSQPDLEPTSDPATSTGQLPDALSWRAPFLHSGLMQQGEIEVTPSGCQMRLQGSAPDLIELEQKFNQRIDSEHMLWLYAGWPRNAQGQITGVVNRSRDPLPRRIYENKLGPTIVWAVSGCQRLCVRGIILNYQMTIRRALPAQTIQLAQIDSPTLDTCAPGTPCLTPAFVSEAEHARGAIDQPGCTVSVVGDGFRDTRGAQYQIEPGDELLIAFAQRALIICDQEVLAITDWRYRLTAVLGGAANAITPTILDNIGVDVILRDDPNPLQRWRFLQVLATTPDAR